jgi:hypothetical protein
MCIIVNAYFFQVNHVTMVKQGHLNVLITWKSYYVECSITFLLLIRKKYFDWNVYYYNILSGKNKYYAGRHTILEDSAERK